MTDDPNEQGTELSTDQAAESGALDQTPEQGEERSTDEPAESGPLQEEQQGKGYGAG